MCGLAGFSGITDQRARAILTRRLAHNIDHRGGHAAGFVAVTRSRLRHGRTLGEWKDAANTFLDKAASGSVASMLHSRFATCGKHTVSEAHPFAIERNGKVAIYGAHNGVIDNAHEVAREAKRSIVVDSEELFHRIVDNDLTNFRELEGYGAITWILAESPAEVYLARISETGDLEACELAEGGIVWASTDSIMGDAIRAAGLTVGRTFELKTGQVYIAKTGKLYLSPHEGHDNLTLGDSWWRKSSARGSWNSAGIYTGSRGASGWNEYEEPDFDPDDPAATWWREYLEECREKDEAEARADAEFAADLDDSWEEPEPSPEATGPELWRYLARAEAQERRERKSWERRRLASMRGQDLGDSIPTGRERCRVEINGAKNDIDVAATRNFSTRTGSDRA